MKPNPYYAPLNRTFKRLILINGVFFQFHGHIRQRTNEVAKTLKARGRRHVPWMAGAALVIRDMTDTSPNAHLHNFPIGVHARKGAGFLSVLQELVALNAGWAISQGFEAFEGFAWDLGAVYLKRHPATVDLPAWKRRIKGGAPAVPASRRLSDHRAWVRRAYRDAADVVKRLRTVVPKVAFSEQNNNRNLDFQLWLKVVAEVRHGCVHNSAVLSKRQLDTIGPQGVTLLMTAFPGRQRSDGYHLCLTAESVEGTLELFAEYALLVFKQTSAQDGLDPESFRTVSIRV